jgi:hypothetical protein
MTITTTKKFNFEVTGQTERYCKAYEIAGKIVIEALVTKGRNFITLDEIYDILNAVSSSEKNGVQWAVDRAKVKGLICKTLERGVYRVC